MFVCVDTCVIEWVKWVLYNSKVDEEVEGKLCNEFACADTMGTGGLESNVVDWNHQMARPSVWACDYVESENGKICSWSTTFHDKNNSLVVIPCSWNPLVPRLKTWKMAFLALW